MKMNENGFTLIESLLVLSIFLIITSVTAFSMKPQYEMIESKAFINQLQADLFYGQQYAISHQHELTVMIIPDQHYYYVRNSITWPPFVLRYYSNNVKVSQGTLPLTFKFNASGFVNKSGYFKIQCGSKHYRLTVLLGQGRFYVTEE